MKKRPISGKENIQCLQQKRSWLKYSSSLVPFCFFLFVLISTSTLQAQDRSKTYQTTYASIAFGNDKDFYTFTKNIGSGLSFLSESPEKNPLLAKNRVDKIVEMARSLLDMHPVNLRFNIALCRTKGELLAAYRSLGMLGTVPRSFYYHRNRTIFINIDDISDRILAHEIAHTIICAYFGMPPPSRMQEILAQYVDKHLWDE